MDGAHERTAEDGVDDVDTSCREWLAPALGSPVVIFVLSAGGVLTEDIAARQADNCAHHAINT
jgi:hypothetical protein